MSQALPAAASTNNLFFFIPVACCRLVHFPGSVTSGCGVCVLCNHVDHHKQCKLKEKEKKTYIYKKRTKKNVPAAASTTNVPGTFFHHGGVATLASGCGVRIHNPCR